VATDRNGNDREITSEPPKRRPRRETAPEEAERDGRAGARRSHSEAVERRRPPSLKAADVAQLALRQVQELTGKDPEGVTSLQRSEEGWLVAVEVVEAHRIPNTTDILAVYEAELDDDGDLISYRRIDRYARGQGEQR
jgi:hypothetical protein